VVHQKTFKIVRPTLALNVVDGKQRIVTIPADAIVMVPMGAPDRSGLLKVCWDERSLRMFAVDLSARGIDITEGNTDDTQVLACLKLDAPAHQLVRGQDRDNSDGKNGAS
jgi:hypothetical protein